jgi:hypothetical protein
MAGPAKLRGSSPSGPQHKQLEYLELETALRATSPRCDYGVRGDVCGRFRAFNKRPGTAGAAPGTIATGQSANGAECLAQKAQELLLLIRRQPA